MNKYEKLIEYVIGNDEAKAEELFHEIVVEKSRDIYESLMDEDAVTEEFGGDPADELIKDVAADEEGMVEDDMNGEFTGEPAGDDMSAMGGEEEIGMDDEMGMPPEGEEGHEEAELEDRVVDLEDQLDSLMAEFDSMMGGEDEMGMEPEMGMDDEMGGEEEFGAEEEMGMEGRFNEAVSLTKVTTGISNSTESEGTNKTSINADNSGAKGAAAKPVTPTGTEAKGQANPTVKPGDGTTEPRESKVTEPKKKGEDAGVNKKSLSGS